MDLEPESTCSDNMTELESALKTVAKVLENPDSKVVFFVGAGISSTSDGEPLIPDFRSPGTGLYYNLAKLNLPSPESVFDIDFFEDNPKPFYSLCKDLHPAHSKFAPTRFHYFMKMVNEKNDLVRVFTQNIDCLERETGLAADKIVEAHGSFAEEFCIKCKKRADKEKFVEQMLRDEIPKCEYCKGTVKPSIVFFGEQLPERFYERLDVDLDQLIDVCIVAGTSLKVHPFASLPSEVDNKCLRVLINNEKVGDFQENPRDGDLLAIGDCDEIADTIAGFCGWKQELDAYVDLHKTKQHAKTAVEMVEDMKKNKNLEDKYKGKEEAKKDSDVGKVEDVAELLLKLKLEK